jgi:hypothetical protein
VLAHVSRDLARIQVITGADAVADVEIDGLALVEVGHALGTAVGGGDNQESGGQQATSQHSKHLFLPLERLPRCGFGPVRHYPRRRIDLTRTRDMVLPQPGDFVVLGPRSKEQAK